MAAAARADLIARPAGHRNPGLQRLVISYVMPGPDGTASAYDAVAEDWFESPEAMQAALASPEGQAVYADTPNFADVDRLARSSPQWRTDIGADQVKQPQLMTT